MKKYIYSFSFCIFLFCSKVFSQNEVMVNVMLTPPYSPYLSTYVDQPNKLLLTVTNLNGQQHDVKLWVQITGDNGVSVTTASGFHPSQPIHLNAYEVKPIDFSTPETRDYFDANNVTLAGITKAQLIQNQALPEGTYTICVRALDYITGAPISADGCSAPFPLYYIDPPLAVQPACGNEVTASTPQNVVFSWTPPATAPGNIQYEFTLKEVPNNLNPNDVIKNAAFPVLFSTIQTASNVLVYTVTNPQLETGKKYVWRVKAIDPLNTVQFKNNGFSEACSFDYMLFNPNVTPTLETNIITLTNNSTPALFITFQTEGQGTILFPPLFSTSSVNGQAVYHYPNESGTYPLKFATLRLVVGYMLKDNNGKQLNDFGFGSDVPDGILDKSEMAVTTTDENGNFNFSFFQNATLGKVSDYYRSGGGEFVSSGNLYRYAYITIDNPHAEFYNNVFDQIFYFNSGDNVNAGTISTQATAKSLVVTVKRNLYAFQELENTSDNLAGANVYLCRKPLDSWSKNVYPQEDGAPDNQMQKPDALNGLEVVAKGETNSSGQVTFTRMIDHHNPNYTYYVYADFPKDADGFSNYILNSGPVERSYGCGTGLIICDPFLQTLYMDANFPRVSGWVEDATDGKRIPALVLLKSLYLGFNNQNILSHPYDNVTNDEWNLRSQMQNSQCGVCIANSTRINGAGQDGRFEFDQQPIQITTGNVSAVGPVRSLQVYSPGYDDKLFVNIKSPLLIGEQAFVKVSMTRGASISGKVVDGETGKGLSSTFYFIDELKSGYTYSDDDAQANNDLVDQNSYYDYDLGWVTDGSYVTGGGQFKNYPAKKLTTSQKIIFKADGYITDTLDVVIDKKNMDIGTIKLYTLKRRALVIVLDAKTKDPINSATVSLPDIKTTCTEEIDGPKQFGNKTKVMIDCAVSQKTTWGVTGVFSFVNAGGPENNSQVYNVHVEPPVGTEYLPLDLKAIIPYASTPKVIFAYLEPGTCVSGTVYAGTTNSSPVAGAMVKMDVMEPFLFWGNFKTGEATTSTDANGKFVLHHVPLRNYPVTIRAMKSQSQFVGDSASIITDPSGNIFLQMGDIDTKPILNFYNKNKPQSKAPNDNCTHQDFHLSVYNDMDITSLMGFPIAVTDLKPNGTSSATISGYFDGMPANGQFTAKSGQSLSFTNLTIVPGTLKNSNGVPVSQPQTTPVTTNNNSYALSTYGVDGLVEDKKLGIYLDKTVGGSQYGVMKGKVHLKATEFNQTVVGLNNDAYLILPAGTDKMMIPVFNADKSVTSPANAPGGFGIGDVDGNALKFSLPGFPLHAKADLANSKFTSTGELQLATKIETNIPDVTPANLNIDAGIIKLKKGVTPAINTSQPISFKFSDYWSINSSDWKLDENGLKMNNGKLNTGVEFSIQNIGVKYDKLETNTTHVDISSMKLAKVHPVNITSGQQSFGQIIFSGVTKVWQIYVGPDGTGTCGSISNLPGIGAADKITLQSINLYSNGQKNVFMKKSDLMLKNVLPYHTNETSILVNDESFIVNGTFDLNIPDKHTYAAALDYEKGGSSLKDVAFINVAPILFNHPTALNHQFIKSHKLTDGLFTVQGTSEEPGTFPKTNTTFYYSNDSVSVWIDGGQNIPINGERKFGNASGGMKILSNAWTPFWFEGEMQGMAGVSDVQVNGKPQRMKFIVEGDVKADGQSISVSDISTPFGNMSWTYNFPQSQLIGHCDIDMNLGSLGLKGGINSVVDGGGWYFQAAGKVTIPGVGDADLMGVFGSYNSHPEFLTTGLGDVKCLPSAFSTQVKGFLFQAGIHKQVVPDISFEIPALLSVDFGVDVGLTTRIWRSFGASSQYGISLLAAANAHADGSCDATCSDISASASAEIGISGVYNPSDGSYGLNGCASVGFDLQVSQCLGALGICGPCLTIDSGHKDIGVNLTYSSGSGADVSINFGSCDSQCN